MYLGLEAKESDSRKKYHLSLYHMFYADVAGSPRALYLKGVSPVWGEIY